MSTARRSRRLARRWERIRREPGLGRNIAIMLVLVVLAVVTGGYILSQQRVNWPWEDSFHFYATLQETPGVAPGQAQEVRIAGVSVGDIRSVTLDDDGNAKLELAIDPKHTVYDNATVVLRPKSPMNEMYVELDPGGPPGTAVEAGHVLPIGNSERPIQVDEVLGHLDGKVRAALTTLLSESDVALARAPEQLPEGLSATASLTRNLKPVAEALQERKQKLAKLVTSLRQIADAVGRDDERLMQLAESLRQTLGSLSRENDSLNAALTALPDTTKQLKKATDAVQGLSDQLDPTLDSLRRASGTLPDSLARLTDTIDRVDRTVDVARPVVAKARPVVADLRPFIRQTKSVLPELTSISKQLDPVTGNIVSYLDDLGAFVLNSRSMTSLTDSHGGFLRGQATVAPSAVPPDLLQSLAPSTPK